MNNGLEALERSQSAVARIDGSRSQRRIHVQTLFLKRFIARKNSDYANYRLLKNISNTYPIDVSLCDSLPITLTGNLIYALETLLYRQTTLRNFVTWRYWRAIKRASWMPRRYLIRNNADILFTNSYFPVNRVGIPVVFEYDFFAFGIPSVRDEVARLLYIPEWIIDRADAVVVRYDLSLEAFRQQFPQHAKKGVLIYPYLPHVEAVPTESVDQKFHRFGRPDINILFVGNMAKLKGLPELVQAYEIVKAERPEVRLTVVSRFQDGPILLPPDVRVLSNLSYQQVCELMAQAHIYAMPTKKEPSGAVFWEAMANGCALLTPHISPQRELFGEFGLSADPTDPVALAKALNAMVEQPEACRAWAIKARETFLEKYHHSLIGQRYYELFSGLIR